MNAFNFRSGIRIAAIWIGVLLVQTSTVHAQLTAQITPGVVQASSFTVLQLRFTATDTIPQGSLIKVMTPSGIRNILWPFFSNIYPSTTGASGLTVTSYLSPQLEQPPIWDDDNLPAIITMRLRYAPLLPGEQINITLGNRDWDGVFLVEMLKTACIVHFRIAVVDVHSQQWTEVAKVPLTIAPGPPETLKLFAPTIARTGDTAWYKISIWDADFNRTSEFQGTLQFQVDDNGADYPEQIVFSAVDTGYKEIPVVFSGEGFFTATVRVSETGPTAGEIQHGHVFRSNVTWARQDPDYFIYWGDLHSHSGYSRDAQGYGSFNYARYTSCLDFFSAAEHLNGTTADTFGINPEEWALILQDSREQHEPGKFVPIVAYESSYYAMEGGHHVMYFEHEDSVAHLIPLLPRKTYRSIFALWDQLLLLPPSIKALSWPHFTGQPFYFLSPDPSWGLESLSINQGSLPRLVGAEYVNPLRTMFEIYSDHGQSEYFSPGHRLNGRELSFWFVQDALAMGEKVGFIASTDDHTARPGFPGAGQGAVLSPTLDRPGIFNALRNRSTYATTGERILMDFRINDVLMGGELQIVDDRSVDIEWMVYGTAPVKRVEIVRWDFINGTYAADFHPQFEVIYTEEGGGGVQHLKGSWTDREFSGEAVYYLRVEQENEVLGIPVWGWSSPVWVNNGAGVGIPTGVQEEIRVEMAVFPNPVPRGGMLALQLKGTVAQEGILHIVNTAGQIYKIWDVAVPNDAQTFMIPLQGLPPGVYWIVLSDRQARLQARRAIVIQ